MISFVTLYQRIPAFELAVVGFDWVAAVVSSPPLSSACLHFIFAFVQVVSWVHGFLAWNFVYVFQLPSFSPLPCSPYVVVGPLLQLPSVHGVSFFLAPVSPAAFPSNYQTRKSSGQTAIGESWWKILGHLLLFTSGLKSSNFSVTQNEFLKKVLKNLSKKTPNGIYSC